MKYLVLVFLIACSSQERNEEDYTDMRGYYGCYHKKHLGYYPEYYRNKPCDSYEKENREIVIEEAPKLDKDSEYAKYETVPIGETVESYETELIPFEDPDNKTTKDSTVEIIDEVVVEETPEFIDGEIIEKVEYQKFEPAQAQIEEVKQDSKIIYKNTNEELEDAFEEVVPEDY